MKMRYSYHRASERGDLPRILFYSVFLHYVIFFIFFGNPFLMQGSPGEGGSIVRLFDVQLLSPPEAAPPGAPRPSPVSPDTLQLGGNLGDMSEEDIARLFEAPIGFQDGKVTGAPSLLQPSETSSLDDGISVIKALNTLPEVEEIHVPEKKDTDLPPNVKGPEDCLLKVVGMVCPNGDASCIAAYKAFCASLPK